MYCTNCGQQNIDTARFCKGCGTPLAQCNVQAQPQNAQVSAPVPQPAPVASTVATAPTMQAQPKKRNSGLLVFVLLALAVIVFAAWKFGVLGAFGAPAPAATSAATVAAWQEQYDLGVRYVSEGNYKEAAIAFAAAIEINPKQVEAYLALADVYVEQGDAEAAIAVLAQGYQETSDETIVAQQVEIETQREEIAASGASSQVNGTSDASSQMGGTSDAQPLQWEIMPTYAFDDMKPMMSCDTAAEPFTNFYTYQRNGRWGVVDSAFTEVLLEKSEVPHQFCHYYGHVLYANYEDEAQLAPFGLEPEGGHDAYSPSVCFFIQQDSHVPSYTGSVYNRQTQTGGSYENEPLSTYPNELTEPVLVQIGVSDNHDLEWESYHFTPTSTLYGYAGADGTVLVEPQYVFATDFSSGAAAVSYSGEEWAYMDETGALITDFVYTPFDAVPSFRSAVENAFIPQPYDFIDGYCVVKKGEGQVGVINLQGEEVVDCVYQNAVAMPNGRIMLQQDGLWGIVDLTV